MARGSGDDHYRNHRPGIQIDPARQAESILASLTGDEPQAENLAIAAAAALLGGAEVLHYYQNSELSIHDTGAGPVTIADRASHNAIVEFIRSRCSDVVLSEEAAWEETSEEVKRLWIVDPLDGTQEFIDRISEFCVMVGLAIEGRAMLGAVYRPDPGVLYLGISDRAAWRMEGAAGTVEVLTIQEHSGDSLCFVRSRSHPDARLRELELALAPTEIIASGSVGVKCMLIAEGKADLYVHPVPYLKEWDTCAPEAILRGAGGRVSDCLGQPFVYGKPEPAQPAGIFAATHGTWLKLADQVARSVQTL